MCVQVSYTTQHGAVLIIFSLNFQISITAKILFTVGEVALELMTCRIGKC